VAPRAARGPRPAAPRPGSPTATQQVPHSPAQAHRARTRAAPATVCPPGDLPRHGTVPARSRTGPGRPVLRPGSRPGRGCAVAAVAGPVPGGDGGGARRLRWGWGGASASARRRWRRRRDAGGAPAGPVRDAGAGGGARWCPAGPVSVVVRGGARWCPAGPVPVRGGRLPRGRRGVRLRPRRAASRGPCGVWVAALRHRVPPRQAHRSPERPKARLAEPGGPSISTAEQLSWWWRNHRRLRASPWRNRRNRRP
jgi:hypothetical protein